jgi:hypothetical protein
MLKIKLHSKTIIWTLLWTSEKLPILECQKVPSSYNQWI